MAAPPFEVGPLEPVPAVPTAVAIADGELVLTSEQGVYVRSDQGWVDAGLPGARSIFIEPAGSFLLCGEKGVTRYSLDEEVLTDQPCKDIVVAGDALWALDDDGVFDVSTLERVELDGPVDALGGGAQSAWLSGNSLVVGDTKRLVFPGATDVAQVPQPSDLQWVLVHPQRSLVGLLGETGLESAWPQPLGATSVAVGDLGNDGTLDIVLAGPDGWMPLTLGAATPPPAPRPLAVPAAEPTHSFTPPPPRMWKRPETASILGLRMPRFAGLDPDPDYDSIFVGGFGLAVGSALGPSQIAVGFSPAAVGGVERGGKRIRSYFGADSAPLFAWVGDTGGIHLAMATGGFSIGSDRLRAGPFASIGLLGAGAGLRAVFTPFESRAGKLTGFEGRLTWFAPQAGHASLYYVSAFPLGRRYGPPSSRATRSSACDRFGFALGAAGGVSSTALAWEFVGRDDAYQFSGSPAFALSCESGSKSSGWHIGGETAPFFFYRVPTTDGGADRRLRQMGTITLGLYAGGNKLRVGPIATAGIWQLGGGVRAVLTPIITKGKVHHGIELRALALFPSAPSGQGMVLYHVWFDPKATQKHPEESDES